MINLNESFDQLQKYFIRNLFIQMAMKSSFQKTNYNYSGRAVKLKTFLKKYKKFFLNFI